MRSRKLIYAVLAVVFAVVSLAGPRLWHVFQVFSLVQGHPDSNVRLRLDVVPKRVTAAPLDNAGNEVSLDYATFSTPADEVIKEVLNSRSEVVVIKTSHCSIGLLDPYDIRRAKRCEIYQGYGEYLKVRIKPPWEIFLLDSGAFSEYLRNLKCKADNPFIARGVCWVETEATHCVVELGSLEQPDRINILVCSKDSPVARGVIVRCDDEARRLGTALMVSYSFRFIGDGGLSRP